MNYAIKYKLEKIIEQNHVIKYSTDDMDEYKIVRPVNKKSSAQPLLFTAVCDRFHGEFTIKTNDDLAIATGDLLEPNANTQDVLLILQSCEDKYQKQIRKEEENKLSTIRRGRIIKAARMMDDNELVINKKLNSMLGYRQR